MVLVCIDFWSLLSFLLKKHQIIAILLRVEFLRILFFLHVIDFSSFLKFISYPCKNVKCTLFILSKQCWPNVIELN